jgi:phage head maturation protease
MKRGDINQMSFAFSIDRAGQNWEKQGDADWERTITKVSRLYDVSVVTFPAYPQTDAAVRALNEFKAAAISARPAGELQRRIDHQVGLARLVESSL